MSGQRCNQDHFCKTVSELIHTATPDTTKLSCLCRVRFDGVNWIPPSDNSRLSPTEYLKSEHVNSTCPIRTATPDTTRTGLFCRVWCGGANWALRPRPTPPHDNDAISTDHWLAKRNYTAAQPANFVVNLFVGREILYCSRYTGSIGGDHCSSIIYTRSTQPCVRPGSLNRVPASAGVRAGMSPLPGGR